MSEIESPILEDAQQDAIFKLLFGEITTPDGQIIMKYKNVLHEMHQDSLRNPYTDKPYYRSLILDCADFEHVEQYIQNTAETIPAEIILTHLYHAPIPVTAEIKTLVNTVYQMINEQPPTININIRFSNLQSPYKGLAAINAENVDRFIEIKGTVSSVRERINVLRKGKWRCPLCQSEITMTQRYLTVYEPPPKCQNPDCENKDKVKGLKLIIEESEFMDIQEIHIQEDQERLGKGIQFRTIKAILYDDAIESIIAGDNVTATGTLTASPDLNLYAEAHKIPIFTNLFLLSFAKTDERPLFQEDLKYTEDDFYERVRDEYGNYDHEKAEAWWDTMTSWLAYDYAGGYVMKQALLCQLCSGRILDTAEKIYRSEINLLIIGAPGTGKTTISKQIAYFAPKSIKINSSRATEAGVTAGMTYEKNTAIINSGSFVLADNGMIIIDEIDKMPSKVQNALLEPMESQKITINLVGVNKTLNARCDVLALGNPRDGDYNYDKTFNENLKDIIPPLIDRFDLIFVLLDIDTRREIWEQQEQDQMLGRKILWDQRITNNQENQRYAEIQKPSEEDLIFLQEYILYLKKKNAGEKIGLTEECKNAILEYWNMRRQDTYHSIQKEDKIIKRSINTRFLFSIIRLTIARANALLKENADVSDFEKARDIYEDTLRNLNDEGELDMNLIEQGERSSSAESKLKFLQLIADLYEHHNYKAYTLDELKERAHTFGILREYVDNRKKAGKTITEDIAFEKLLNIDEHQEYYECFEQKNKQYIRVYELIFSKVTKQNIDGYGNLLADLELHQQYGTQTGQKKPQQKTASKQPHSSKSKPPNTDEDDDDDDYDEIPDLDDIF